MRRTNESFYVGFVGSVALSYVKCVKRDAYTAQEKKQKICVVEMLQQLPLCVLPRGGTTNMSKRPTKETYIHQMKPEKEYKQLSGHIFRTRGMINLSKETCIFEHRPTKEIFTRHLLSLEGLLCRSVMGRQAARAN